jgi:hypothetical protein
MMLNLDYISQDKTYQILDMDKMHQMTLKHIIQVQCSLFVTSSRNVTFEIRGRCVDS